MPGVELFVGRRHHAANLGTLFFFMWRNVTFQLEKKQPEIVSENACSNVCFIVRSRKRRSRSRDQRRPRGYDSNTASGSACSEGAFPRRQQPQIPVKEEVEEKVTEDAEQVAEDEEADPGAQPKKWKEFKLVLIWVKRNLQRIIY